MLGVTLGLRRNKDFVSLSLLLPQHWPFDEVPKVIGGNIRILPPWKEHNLVELWFFFPPQLCPGSNLVAGWHILDVSSSVSLPFCQSLTLFQN